MESGAAGEAPEPRWEGGYTGFMWFGAGMIGLALVLFTAGQAEALVKCLVCHGKPTLSRTLPSGTANRRPPTLNSSALMMANVSGTVSWKVAPFPGSVWMETVPFMRSNTALTTSRPTPRPEI